MCAKLEAFIQGRKDNTSTSTLRERIRFWRKEEKRAKKVKKLEEQNKKLERLLQRCCSPQISTMTLVQIPKGWQASIDKIQSLGRILYNALLKCWACNCGIRHEARFSLKSIDHSVVVAEVVEGNFDFLVRTGSSLGGTHHWHEGNILVRPKSSIPAQQQEALLKICEATQTIPGGMRLSLLIEDLQGTPKPWKLRPQPRRLKFTHAKPSVSLTELLKASMVEAAEFKKELALTVALSLLGLEEGTWLSHGWTKQNISFFHTADNKLDYGRPFFSTSFDHVPATLSEERCSGHRNPRILDLGILLLEIELGRPLESYRAEIERYSEDSNPYSDFGVADHVAERKLIGSSVDYREAVQACLRTPWVPGDQEVSLSDPRVRAGLYADVILKLKNEVEYMLRRTF
ncbi:hypothetical protein FH972_024225 [Carpinus fangiana]|uniref:DUF7580 domain-containing protein n=1 Tax=Carpinus fangiana TaxID=176857 RepID=A0A5N6KY51_9ROSI|nr:hypothetical protein FH972_024225 [Carpinus fangiana]